MKKKKEKWHFFFDEEKIKDKDKKVKNKDKKNQNKDGFK